MGKRKKGGLYNKYIIQKADGSPIDLHAVYFVLRLDTEPAARRAIGTYAHACQKNNPQLASELLDLVQAIEHHEKHGDMDGNVCLLSECAWHYPATGLANLYDDNYFHAMELKKKLP